MLNFLAGILNLSLAVHSAQQGEIWWTFTLALLAGMSLTFAFVEYTD